MSLFGYDDQEIARAYSPAISSVSPPLRTMGIRSAELVFSQMDNSVPESQCVLIPCAIHARGSLASPPSD